MSQTPKNNTKAEPFNPTSLPILPDLAPLVLVGPELVERGFSAEPVPYHRLHRAVTSGQIAAQRNPGGRIGIRRADYPAVAAALGLVPAASSSSSQPASAAA